MQLNLQTSCLQFCVEALIRCPSASEPQAFEGTANVILCAAAYRAGAQARLPPVRAQSRIAFATFHGSAATGYAPIALEGGATSPPCNTGPRPGPGYTAWAMRSCPANPRAPHCPYHPPCPSKMGPQIGRTMHPSPWPVHVRLSKDQGGVGQQANTRGHEATPTSSTYSPHLRPFRSSCARRAGGGALVL